MATVDLLLPVALDEWVQTQVDSGRFSNPSDYVRELIQREQDRLAETALMQKLADDSSQSSDDG